jgi:UDP-N-acetylglucosamine:LPS N-acetylglucosamine transferase
MRKITLLYIDSGGGHRAAATALRDVIGRQGRPWEVEMVCIQNLFAPIDFVRQYTGIQFQDVYNIVLRKGWTLGSEQMIRAMHLLMRMSHGSQVQMLRQYWAQSQPDMVVSLIPHFNRAIKEALDTERPGIPFVTILTDIADHPPHFWIERESQYVVCGSERAANQARAIGIAPDRVFQTSGMILNPAFYSAPQVNRDVERIRLGLHPDIPTGLVLFGGEGSDDMVTIARALNKMANRPVQLILLCGKNAKVAAELRALGQKIPMFIEGFTREVPFYMELADFFIGKPGPGSISEALAKQLPVIVQRNAWTLAHERYNADWVEEQGTGLVVKDFAAEIGAAVETLLKPENYERFRRRAAETRNMAVFEIPDFLDKILQPITGPIVNPSVENYPVARNEVAA